jgi:hypothetical protein
MSLACGFVVLSWDTYSPVDVRVDSPIVAVEANVKFWLHFFPAKLALRKTTALYTMTQQGCAYAM